MARRRSKPAFKQGQVVKTRYYLQGGAVGISEGMLVDIHEVYVGKAPEIPRYRVSYCGGPKLWFYEDRFQALGEGE